jgi:hypothetical protein
LDHGFAALYALIINRSGGFKQPNAPLGTVGTAADPRDYLWEKGPAEPEPELTPESAFMMLGGRPRGIPKSGKPIGGPPGTKPKTPKGGFDGP